MEGLLSVSVGTVFWASLAFIIVVLLLSKLAWKPIVKSLNDRAEGIEEALRSADRAREEMAKLQAGNEQLLRQAREERDELLKAAKVVADKVKADAQARAQAESDRMISAAIAEIDNQKKAAIAELKNQVATLSIEIAERLVKEKLNDAEKQKALNSTLISEIKAN
jgi:F-type H+-transporting ATPase subunit b